MLNNRVPLWLWVIFAAAAFLAGACRDNSSGQTHDYAGTELSGPAPQFQLMDQNNHSVALADFLGDVVVLAFLDPRCTDVCPLTAFHFS